MKKLLILLTFLGMFYENVAWADGYPNILGIGGDKYLHFGVSGLLDTGLYMFLSMPSRLANVREGRIPALIGAAGFSFGLGLAKEVMDANGGYLDGGDLTADVIGVVVTSTIIYFVDIHGRKDPMIPQVGFSGRNLTLGWRF